jgi:hypothetical protein
MPTTGNLAVLIIDGVRGHLCRQLLYRQAGSLPLATVALVPARSYYMAMPTRVRSRFFVHWADGGW